MDNLIIAGQRRIRKEKRKSFWQGAFIGWIVFMIIWILANI